MSIHSIITAAIAYGALAISAKGVVIYGLGSNSRLYSFDSASPGAVTDIGALSGVVDIDFHAVNGSLYGVAADGLTYTINISTGAKTLVTTPLTALSGLTSMDFNPVVDRIRLVGTGNANYRITPNAQTPAAQQPNGTVSVDGNFTAPGFSVLGVAYTNAFDGTASTALYSLGSNGNLNLHSVAPGFNTLATVGSGLGFTPVGSGFDIAADANGAFLGSAYAYDGTNLQLVNLTTGAGASQGAIALPGGVSLLGLAVIPEPSTFLLAAVGGLGLLRRRRTV